MERGESILPGEDHDCARFVSLLVGQSRYKWIIEYVSFNEVK